MTIDDDEALPDAVEPPAPDRKSVTVTLPSSRTTLRLLAIVLVLGLIATVIVESIHIHNLDTSGSASTLPPLTDSTGGGLDATSRSAIAAATSYAQSFATYDYLHLTQDFAVTEAHAVDPFLSEYTKETAAIRPSLVKAKARSTGIVKSAGIVSVSPTSAVVDLFLNQSVVNAASTKPQVNLQRVTMSLTRVGSEWKITKVVVDNA